MKTGSIFLLCWAFLFSLPAQNLLLENASIVDPETQTIETGTLWIQDGRIHQRLKKAPKHFDGERIDLRGKYLLPSLLDLHTHSWGNSGLGGNMEMLMTEKTAERMLYCGVSSFLDLFSEENYIFALRDRQRAEGGTGADLYCAGPILTCEGGHGTEYGIPTRLINTPEEAVTVVRDLAQRKPDVIKIVYDNAPGRLPTINKATLQAAIKAATEAGFKTVIHIGTWQDIIDALEAGASAITHLPEGPMPVGVPQWFLDHGAVLIPTLTVESELTHLIGNADLLNSKLLAGAVSPLVIDSYREAGPLDPRSAAFLDFQREIAPFLAPAIQALAAAGVPILTGTDGGNPGVFQGYSVHREMALLARAGMSNWRVLAAATTQAGDFLGLSYGVEEGDLANLLVLAANPVENLAHVEQIEKILHHGQWVDREKLAYREQKSQRRTASGIADFEEGIEGWTALSDQVQGGLSELTISGQEGLLQVNGVLKIGDQMPYAWVMLSYNFQANGDVEDLTVFEGVRIRYRLPTGQVYLSLMDVRIQNFDYHAAFLQTGADWQEMEIPFSTLRQNFTQPPIPWQGEKILGLAIGSSGAQAASFQLEIDWIELY